MDIDEAVTILRGWSKLLRSVAAGEHDDKLRAALGKRRYERRITPGDLDDDDQWSFLWKENHTEADFFRGMAQQSGDAISKVLRELKRSRAGAAR